MTQDEFRKRHEFCVYPWEIAREILKLRQAGIEIREGRWESHCDHPEDGFCGTSIKEEDLEKINGSKPPKRVRNTSVVVPNTGPRAAIYNSIVGLYSSPPYQIKALKVGEE